jgi:hypothetical protein
MKTKTAIIVSIVVFILASCAPAVKAIPTSTLTPEPTSTLTPILGHLDILAFHDLDADGSKDEGEPSISGVEIASGERSCRSNNSGICDLGQEVFGEHQISVSAEGYPWVVSSGGSIRGAAETLPFNVNQEDQELLLPLVEEVFRFNGVVIPKDYVIAVWPIEKTSYLFTSTGIDMFGISGQPDIVKNSSDVNNQRIICVRAGTNPSHIGTDIFTPGNEYSASVNSMFDARLIAAGKRSDGTTIVVYKGILEDFNPEGDLTTYEIAVSVEHLSNIELAENLLTNGGGKNIANDHVYDIDYSGITGDVYVPRGTTLGTNGNSIPMELGGNSGFPHTHLSGYLIVNGVTKRSGIIEFENQLPLPFLGNDTILEHIVTCWPSGSGCCK